MSRSSCNKAESLTFHQVIVFRDLLWRRSFLDVREDRHKNVLSKWPDIRLGESVILFSMVFPYTKV
jgi:hypothetical protein